MCARQGLLGLQIRVTAQSSRPAGGAPRIRSELALGGWGEARVLCAGVVGSEAKPGKVIYCTQLYSGHSNPLFSLKTRSQGLSDGALGTATPRTDSAKDSH